MQRKTRFEKEVYKFRINVVLRKTMDNVRKRQNVKLRNEKQAHKHARNPRFKRFTIFDDDFLAGHMGKVKVKFDKPACVGFSVLELSS